ncbi:MAG: TMEM165/GDT1 family protein [Asticcacaulis sp.]
MSGWDALSLSTALVAVAEIGDKTQLLALCLAARWKKPLPILLGILVATLANHALAVGLGALAGQWLDGPWMRWILGAAFLAFAVWALIPDGFDEAEEGRTRPARSFGGIVLATTIAFFFVEMGDKTQIASAALGARYQDLVMVTLGTTLGMMIANAPAVLIGEAAATRLPLRWIRYGAAALFALTGLWVLVMG